MEMKRVRDRHVKRDTEGPIVFGIKKSRNNFSAIFNTCRNVFELFFFTSVIILTGMIHGKDPHTFSDIHP